MMAISSSHLRNRFGIVIGGKVGLMTAILNDNMYDRLIRECAEIECSMAAYIRIALHQFLPGEKMVPMPKRFECFMKRSEIPKTKIVELALMEYWEDERID